jgi:acetyltransferase-like isoleucine patch superfamily enzyme
MSESGRSPGSLCEADFVGSVWRFGRADGSKGSVPIRFLTKGKIGLYQNLNESHWTFKDGILTLVNAEGKPSTRFTDVEVINDRFKLSGQFLLQPQLNIVHTLEPWDWEEKFPRSTSVLLRNEIRNFGWKIGENTYGHPGVIHTGMPGDGYAVLSIGKYTSIASNVLIVLANHRTDTVTTYPFKLHRPYWPSAPKTGTDFTSRGHVSIGNDVWIGAGVTIMPGVTIGHGAVLGAQSVVTKNVEPYQIVGGNPSRPIRARFPPGIVERLLKVAWWDWPNEVVDEHLHLLTSNKIEDFLDAAERHLSQNPT